MSPSIAQSALPTRALATRAGFVNSVSPMASKAFHLGPNERQQSLDQALKKAETPGMGAKDEGSLQACHGGLLIGPVIHKCHDCLR